MVLKSIRLTSSTEFWYQLLAKSSAWDLIVVNIIYLSGPSFLFLQTVEVFQDACIASRESESLSESKKVGKCQAVACPSPLNILHLQVDTTEGLAWHFYLERVSRPHPSMSLLPFPILKFSSTKTLIIDIEKQRAGIFTVGTTQTTAKDF